MALIALITCPECQKIFSDKADACPECACPVSAMESGQEANPLELSDPTPSTLSFDLEGPRCTVLNMEEKRGAIGPIQVKKGVFGVDSRKSGLFFALGNATEIREIVRCGADPLPVYKVGFDTVTWWVHLGRSGVEQFTDFSDAMEEHLGKKVTSTDPTLKSPWKYKIASGCLAFFIAIITFVVGLIVYLSFAGE